MTCPCDATELDYLEAVVASLLADAQGKRAANVGLPPICDIIPYHEGATNAQKKCHAAQSMIMLGRWLYCYTQSDPSACFSGECDDYADRVAACYPA